MQVRVVSSLILASALSVLLFCVCVLARVLDVLKHLPEFPEDGVPEISVRYSDSSCLFFLFEL
jgi:hypothetical protein